MKPGAPSLLSIRLLDQVRERVSYMHYSLKTENDYLYWIRFFIFQSATQSGGMRHPHELGVADVVAFLSLLANERKISTSHNQGHSGGADQGRDSWPIGTNGEVTALLAGGYRQPFGFIASSLSRTHKRTGMPRSRIRSLACCTVYSP
jgi:hypothetical protein